MKIKSECCPVKYLEAYLQKAKLNVSDDKKCPLICHIFKIKSGHKVSKTKAISSSRIREIFKGYISVITTALENKKKPQDTHTFDYWRF